MNSRSISVSLMILILVGLSTSCTRKSEYQKLVESELSTNVRQDSLYLGISLQMESKDFFVHCWEMNKKGLLTNGVGNQIKYDASEFFEEKTSMHFYPKFVDGKIFEMPVEFKYDNWALWNEELSVDNLIEDVISVLESWYGEGFIKMVNDDGSKTVWVKVDGNRRIRVYRQSISSVSVIFTDLVKLNEINSEKS
ncbi:hypothetical protein [Roseivirga sp. E12]|uniref:hypothetical protein n=1 Tax=Roseivirga sp. E12 TaxID=2819237 RepID=UPI001ABC5B5D|nr:hypothetical protein [Roseivirga sp. E12]MBO3698871.1 hypothetical protein [Roseivirga sp. E12]